MYEGKILEAIHFASEKHKDQTRKVFNYPYITHPFVVFYVCSQFTKDENILVSALLHDTVEDTPTSFDEIQNHFGKKVEEYVRILSEDKSLPRKERKESYRKNFETAPQEMCLVKAVDIYCNLKDSIKVYSENPESEFAFHISNKSWIIEKKALIETLQKNWEKNPLIPKIKKLISKFERLISKDE